MIAVCSFKITPYMTLVVSAVQRSTLGDRAFPVTASQAWNSLPPAIRAVSFFISFRQQLKTLECRGGRSTKPKHAAVKQAVGGRPPRYAPTPVCDARCRPAPAHTRLACGAQHALLPVAVGAMNIHDVRDRRQRDVICQTSDKSIA